jgi:hypothetical protein
VNILTTTNDELAYSFRWPRNGATVSKRLQKLLREATALHREVLLEAWQTNVVVKESV